jgi:hypothetical protein
LNILEALDDEHLFKPHFVGESWSAWKEFLAALFALPGSPKTSIEEQFRQETNFDGKFERTVVATAVYPLKRAQCSPIWSQLFEKSSIAPFNSSHAIYLKRGRIRPITGVKQTGTHLSLGSLEKGADPRGQGRFLAVTP